MKRIVVPLLAVLIAAAPMAATAQDHGRRGRGQQEQSDRRDQRERPDTPRAEFREERPQINMGQAVRRASTGRPGRFLGASDRGGVVVVRWEYPGGRIADIMVDGRTGQVLGER